MVVQVLEQNQVQQEEQKKLKADFEQLRNVASKQEKTIDQQKERLDEARSIANSSMG
jgi:hypothetical protein